MGRYVMVVAAMGGCARAAAVPTPVSVGPGDVIQSPVGSVTHGSTEPMMLDGPFVRAATPVEAGRYLITAAGCGNCHTAAHAASTGAKYSELELAGNPVGFRGAWGTSYAANLRLFVQRVSEDRWTQLLKTHTGRPPMPWGNVQQMNERDLRAMYRYIKSLGAAGRAAPKFVPPDQEPATPYVDLTTKNLVTP